MRVILGVPFFILTIVLTLCLLYCVGMGFVDSYAWFFVGLGVLCSDIVAGKIAWELLKHY